MDQLDPGIERGFPALQVDSLSVELTGNPHESLNFTLIRGFKSLLSERLLVKDLVIKGRVQMLKLSFQQSYTVFS